MLAFRTVKGAQFAGKLMRIYIRVVAEKRNLGHSGGALVLVLVFNALRSSALHVQ